MSITILQMADAIKSVIDDLVPDTLNVVQSLDELTEAYADTPMCQIYWDRTEIISESTDRRSFRGGVREYDHTFNADIPCRQRSHIDEDMSAVATITEAVIGELEKQDTKPYFNQDGIKAFRWRCERVTFNPSSDPKGPFYVGVRFIITLRTF